MPPYGFAEEGMTNVDGVVYAWSESQGRMVSQGLAFAPSYSGGVPQVSSCTIATGVSQAVALPLHGGGVRLTWMGLGMFAHRFGASSSVVATSADSPAIAGSREIIKVPSGMTHIAVYGNSGSGILNIEGGTV